MRKLLQRATMPILRYATRSYITGPEIADALKFARAARDQNIAATICYWNDGKEDPAAVYRRYLDTLDAMKAAGIHGNLAVKIPALWDRRDLVSGIVQRGRELGTPVLFDSHAPEQSDLIFAIARELGPEGLGCAIPGRWQRSLQDVERAVEIGLYVRVVKGQWPDRNQPGIDLRVGFLNVIDALAGRAPYVSVATHDGPLVREAIRRLKSAGTPCEHEMLFPLPMQPALDEARSVGAASRLYIPYGEAWLPYSVSRAMDNPRVLIWLVRDLVSGRRLRLPVSPQA